MLKKNRGADTARLPSGSIEFQNIFGQLPQYDAGVSLYSMLVFYQRSHHISRNQAILRVFDLDTAVPPLLLLGGWVVGQASRYLLAGSLSHREALLNHTLWGFYSKFLSPAAQERFLDLMISVPRAGQANEFFATHQGHRIRRRRLDFCPACINADREAGKVPTWKVLHQLPFLSACPWHGMRLQHQCLCGVCVDPGVRFRLPGDCGRGLGCFGEEIFEGQPASAAEQGLAQLCERIFSSEVNWIRPAAWAHLMADLILMHGSVEEAATRICELITTRWGLSFDALSQAFGQEVSAADVKAELQALVYPGKTLARLVVFEVLTTIYSDDWFDTAVTREQHLDLHGKEKLVSELERHAESRNLPLGIVKLIVAGETTSSISAATGGSPKKIDEFLLSLPRETRLEVSELICERIGFVPRLGSWRTDDRVDFHKHALLSLIADRPSITRAQARGMIVESMRVLTRDHSAWLDEVIPRVRVTRLAWADYQDDERRTEASINIIRKLKQENPELKASEFFRRAEGAYMWLKRHRPAVLEEIAPKQGRRKKPFQLSPNVPFLWPEIPLPNRYKSKAERTRLCKRYVEEAVRLNPDLSRGQIRALSISSFNWLRDVEPVWFEEFFGRLRQRAGRSPPV